MKLVSWDSVYIDIVPPYDHIMLAFLSTIVVKCPRCGEIFYRQELDMDHPYKIVECNRCEFRGQYTDWYIDLALRN